MRSKIIKGSLIGVGALVLSTLGIFASDGLRGIDSHIGNLASLGDGAVCGEGTVIFKGPTGLICVDVFEASTGDSCPSNEPRNVLESEKNANAPGCLAASVSSVKPWTFVTLAQAQRVCAQSGKRLPTSDEWYALALGTNDSACLIDGSEPRVVGKTDCISSAGAYDAIGNVWEWVNETVTGREYRGRQLPFEGYVQEADASGVAISTQPETGSELYGKDYFWSKDDGVFGMIRGGFYGSGADAGLYTVNASVSTNFAAQGVGFRCVEDVI